MNNIFVQCDQSDTIMNETANKNKTYALDEYNQ